MRSTISTPRGMLSPTRLASYESSDDVSSGSFTQIEADSNDDDKTELLSVSWNQDYGCFAAGTGDGFRIYTCDPFKKIYKRVLKSGGFRIVEMLFRCNLYVLVGGGDNSQYPPNKAMIWDDSEGRCIGEIAFRSEIRGVKLRRDRIVVALEHKIYVYGFMDLKVLHQVETLSNPRGLCCVSYHQSSFVLACLGLHRGQVRVEHFGRTMTKFINAHDSDIACLVLTTNGKLLATASTKGTLIRIFNTMDGTRLQEVRRGFDRAHIYSIALSPNVQWLALSSDKGTVHLFSLKVRGYGMNLSYQSSTSQGAALCQPNSFKSVEPPTSPNTGANSSSSFSFMKGVLPKYFSSEWSFAQFHLPEDIKFITAFGSQNSLIIVGLDGSFYRCSFDPMNGGNMLQREYIRFLQV